MSEMTCKELVEVVTDYLESALPPTDLALFEEHLAICPYCIEYLSQMQALSGGALRGLGSGDALPADRRDALLEAFRRGA